MRLCIARSFTLLEIYGFIEGRVLGESGRGGTDTCDERLKISRRAFAAYHKLAALTPETALMEDAHTANTRTHANSVVESYMRYVEANTLL